MPRTIMQSGTNPRKQIESIFEIIGTPNENSWPSFRDDLKECSLDLPHFIGRDLRTLVPRLNDNGIDLLRKMLTCNPQSRIAAGDAITHQYFGTLPNILLDLSESKSIFSVPAIRLVDEIQPRSELLTL